MPEKTTGKVFECGGKRYATSLDATWGNLLQRAGRMARYRETSLVLPDETVITPQFDILALGRYVAVAGNILRPRVCHAMNTVAEKLGRITAVVKGTPENAEIILLSGETPGVGWEKATNPGAFFSTNIIHTHGIDESLSALLRPVPTVPIEASPPTHLFTATSLEATVQVIPDADTSAFERTFARNIVTLM